MRDLADDAHYGSTPMKIRYPQSPKITRGEFVIGEGDWMRRRARVIAIGAPA
jgi:hypothetical protein